VVPIILKFHRIGTSVNSTTGEVTTVSGDATSDLTVADSGCFAGANNTSETSRAIANLEKRRLQLWRNRRGTTQDTDAFQRGNFWKLIDRNNYHVRLNPTILAPVVVDVPAANGLSLAADGLLPPSRCAAGGIGRYQLPGCGGGKRVNQVEGN
jgi:hypothetical protein